MTGDNYKQAIGSKNCMQCAAAYMLELPLAAVPDFEKAGPGAWESFEAFFAALGFTTEMLPPNLELLGDYLASGESERGTSHMVVMRDGKLLHDPHPSNAGLAAIQVVWVIARRAGRGKMVHTLRDSPKWTPLFTAPPQRKPLTEEEPVALDWLHKWANQDDGEPETQWHEGYEAARRVVQIHLTAPPQRKPPATIDEMFDRMDKAPRGVFFGHDPMTIWMEAWRAAEQHHGIKEGT